MLQLGRPASISWEKQRLGEYCETWENCVPIKQYTVSTNKAGEIAIAHTYQMFVCAVDR